MLAFVIRRILVGVAMIVVMIFVVFALFSQADAIAGADGAYIPVVQQKNYFLYGSNIGGFLPDVASSFYPDFGSIYVTK